MGVNNIVINITQLGKLNYINKILKTNIRPVFAPRRHGDVRRTYADISKMKKLLDIRKLVQFEEGIKLTVDWFRDK